MTGALPPGGKPRTRAELQDKRDEVEALVWYSRYRDSGVRHAKYDRNDADRAAADNAARRIEAQYAEAISRTAFDDEVEVARLQGQQAALRWALSTDWEELLTHGELYDS